MREIAPGIYVETQYSDGSVGFADTGQGLICIGLPMMPDDAREWLNTIQAALAQRVVTAIRVG
jgi:hypothetical protein